MKIQKIELIKDYKSFSQYQQSDFIDTPFHENVNIFFGENGSGFIMERGTII